VWDAAGGASVAKGHVGHAASAELWLGLGHGLVVAELAALDEHVRDGRVHVPCAQRWRRTACSRSRAFRPRIGEPGHGNNHDATFVQDGDLQPRLRTGGHHVVDSGLNRALQPRRRAHMGNRQVVWLERPPLRNPRPRTGRTRNTSARPLRERWLKAPSRTTKSQVSVPYFARRTPGRSAEARRRR
jgi:hypothetical protein